MKRFLLAGAFAALLTGTANAAPPNFDCYVAQLHSGDVNYHYRCGAPSSEPTRWYGFDKEELAHVVTVVAALGSHIQFELTGRTVDCNPDVCKNSDGTPGTGLVPEVHNINRNFSEIAP